MANFRYRAMNAEGNKIEGKHIADNEAEVMEMIKNNGYYPLKIEEIIESKSYEIKLSQRVTIKDIAVFCRQFYTMLDAGVTINNSLNILSEQITNSKLKKAIKNVEEDVKKGSPLSAAMEKQGDCFPTLLITMVEAGEASGNLDEIMLRMSDHFEKENKINSKIKGAMTYPIILGCVCIIVVVFLLIYIMPTFMDMFEEAGSGLPGTTKLLIAISNFLTSYWYILVGIIAATVFGFKKYVKTDNGYYMLSKLKLSVPIIKTVNKKIIVSRFSRTMSTLLASGVPMGDSLQIISNIVDNKIAKDGLMQVREKVYKGEGLSDPMNDTGLFPQMLTAMLRIGEETGKLDDVLSKTADFYDDEVEAAIQAATTMIEPLLIVVMGIIVGFIMLSIMVPLFNMYSTI